MEAVSIDYMPEDEAIDIESLEYEDIEHYEGMPSE